MEETFPIAFFSFKNVDERTLHIPIRNSAKHGTILKIKLLKGNSNASGMSLTNIVCHGRR